MKAENRLSHLRKASMLSRAELAEAMGVDRAWIELWERGHDVIPEEHREELAARFGVGVAYLMGFHPIQATVDAEAALRALIETLPKSDSIRTAADAMAAALELRVRRSQLKANRAAIHGERAVA